METRPAAVHRLGLAQGSDLDHDLRLLVHSIITSRQGTDGEYKLRGRAIAETDPAVQTDFAHAVTEQLGWRPEVGKFHLFWTDIDDVSFIRWNDATNDQHVTRWPAGIEYVRRGTSATSQGPLNPSAACSSDLMSSGQPGTSAVRLLGLREECSDAAHEE